MATNTSGRGAFVDDLGRTYWTYAISFAAFVALAAVLEQVGVPERVLGYLFVFFTLGAYATIGILARTMQVAEFYAAGRRVPAVYAGMAAASGWLSGAMFLGLAGAIFALGWDGLAFIAGLSAGFVLLAVLIAPYLRKFGAYTIPDFLALRYASRPVRLVAIVVALACSLAFLTAQIYATGLIAARFLRIEFETAIVIAMVTMLISTVFGGMRSLTWSQVAQYIILLIALTVPAVVTAIDVAGNPIPQVAYGAALGEIARLETELVERGLAAAGEIAPHLQPFATLDAGNVLALMLCLMLGTASLPHVLLRYGTTRSVRQTRYAVGWTLLFLMLVLTLAPAYAAFAKLEIYSHVIGAGLGALPDWIVTYSGIGLIDIYGLSLADVAALMTGVGDAIGGGASRAADVAGHLAPPANAAWSGLSEQVREAIYNALADDPAASAEAVWRRAILAASVAGGTYDGLVHLSGFSIDRDAIVIAAPEIAGLPFIFAGVVAAGALAAALSTANALAVSIANALSHDGYFRSIDPAASTAKRLAIARLMLIATIGGATWLALERPGDILSLAAWSFSLAAAGFFPALVLGIWWPRANGWGALAGMVAGFAVTLLYLALSQLTPEIGVAWFGMTPITGAPAMLQTEFVEALGRDTVLSPQVGWFGLSNMAAGLIGVSVGVAVAVAVSLATPPPDAAVHAFIEDFRAARGRSHMERERAAERVREFGSRQV